MDQPAQARTRAARHRARAVILDCRGIVAPDVGTIGALAALQLVARRHGRRLVLRDAAPELIDLLALAGLRRIVPCSRRSVLEPRRQPEQREQPVRVEEPVEPDDAAP